MNLRHPSQATATITRRGGSSVFCFLDGRLLSHSIFRFVKTKQIWQTKEVTVERKKRYKPKKVQTKHNTNNQTQQLNGKIPFTSTTSFLQLSHPTRQKNKNERRGRSSSCHLIASHLRLACNALRGRGRGRGCRRVPVEMLLQPAPAMKREDARESNQKAG